jgi:hypothetical protein
VKRTLYEAEHELFRRSGPSSTPRSFRSIRTGKQQASSIGHCSSKPGGSDRAGVDGRPGANDLRRNDRDHRTRTRGLRRGQVTCLHRGSRPLPPPANSASEREVSPYPGFLSTGSVLTGPRLGDPDLRRPNCGLPDTESVLLNPGYATPLFQWWVDGCHFSAHRNCRRRSRHHR